MSSELDDHLCWGNSTRISPSCGKQLLFSWNLPKNNNPKLQLGKSLWVSIICLYQPEIQGKLTGTATATLHIIDQLARKWVWIVHGDQLYFGLKNNLNWNSYVGTNVGQVILFITVGSPFWIVQNQITTCFKLLRKK